MVTLNPLVSSLREYFGGFLNTRLFDYHFWQLDSTRLIAIVLTISSAVVLILRAVGTRERGRERVALPALLAPRGGLTWSPVRHIPLVLFALGLLFFVVALADPYTSLTQQNVTFPGRRVSIMIDASSSMVAPFAAAGLKTQSSSNSAFFTTVAAAERFVRLRMQGRYRDLMALIEFGNEAYVVTPFTNDYENVLFSISLIGDVVEFAKFPDKGTSIGKAIEQGTQLFKAFHFLDAAGNLMVIFSDGEDSRAIVDGRSVSDIVAEAVDAKIPIYFIRTNYDKQLGTVVPDEQWRTAVERTGGKFYAAADEASILRAIRDVDKVSVGRIEVRQYVTQLPRFSPFAIIAVAVWSAASMLKVTLPYFRRFP